jgi:hypothetical protein
MKYDRNETCEDAVIKLDMYSKRVDHSIRFASTYSNNLL